jgi:diaminopimelate decarboxylase
MDVFHQRISLDETAAIVREALRAKLLDADASAIFHHLGLMRSRIAAVQAAFPEHALHTVAIKANPLVEVLREAVRAGAGLEAASLEEVQLALAAECPPEHIVFDSPAKTIREIEQALRWGVYLNADNFEELRRIAVARNSFPSSSRVGLRINAMVGGGTIGATSVSQADSKFGVPLIAQRPAIVAAFAEYDWLTGLHVHVGSQGCPMEMLTEAADRVWCLRQEIVTDAGKSVNDIDIGGGLPTIYRTETSA